MAQLATINPELGIYAITYIDTQYNPDTKIVEGTTGKKYASTYMGARSRWWDLSMAQAQLEAKGVAEHNKRVQQEILNLQDARANILQGIPQRYDTMYKHHNTQEQMRKEWNAGAGDIWSTTTTGPRTSTTTRPQNRYVGHGAKGAYYVRRDVQGILSGVTSPVAKAASLDAARQVGTLGKDDGSMDQAAWYAINMDIEKLYDSKVNGGMDAGQASIEAQNETLASWESGSPLGKSDASRWKRINNQVKSDFVSVTETSGGKTKTARKGRKTIPQYWDHKTGKTTSLPWTIDPYAYDEGVVVGDIEREILEKEGELRPAIDLIERTRQVQREKFGPGIIQSLAEQFGGRQSYATTTDEARLLQQIEALQARGLTLEQLRNVTGYGTDMLGTPRNIQELYKNPILGGAAKPSEEWKPEPPQTFANPEDAVFSGGGVTGFTREPNKSIWELKDGSYVILEMGGEGAVQVPAEMGFKVGQIVKQGGKPGGGKYDWRVDEVSADGKKITKATFTPKANPRAQSGTAIMDSLNAGVKGQEVEIKPAVGAVTGDQRKAIHWKGGQAIEYTSEKQGDPYVVKNLGSTPAPAIPVPDDPKWERDPKKLERWTDPALRVFPKHEKPTQKEVDELIDPWDPEVEKRMEEERLRKEKLKEEAEGSLLPTEESDTALAVRGSPKIQGHNANLLKGFVGAQALIDKPKSLERRTANAEVGSPAEFARATMDAWKGQDPNQRATLSEMVANIAQQYQGASDSDRQRALEYTVALYQLETESDLLT